MKTPSWLDQLPAPDPSMSKRSVFTHITPLPRTISRDTAVAFLHNHVEMIQMNPLVIRHERTTPPPIASKDEVENMTWYEMTDVIQYIPNTAVKSEVSYKGGFYDLPRGLQTHCFAPGGVDIQGKWHVGGNMPGEEKEPVEIGIEKPREGLYLREDLDLRCNVFLMNFVKRNLKKSHAALVEKLIKKADVVEETKLRSSKPLSALSISESAPPQQNSLFNSPPPLIASNQSSYTSRNPTPLSSQSQLSKAVCSCLGTRHHPACRYYIDIYSDPVVSVLQKTIPPSNPQPQTAQPARAPSWIETPTSSYAAPKTTVCQCSGGIHVEGCPFYPGLRVVQRKPQTPPDLQQAPYQLSWPLSRSETAKSGPSVPERPRSDDWSSYGHQKYDEEVALPQYMYSPFSATDGDWQNSELKPKPLRTSHGFAVAMELEGDMAQKYWQQAGQPD